VPRSNRPKRSRADRNQEAEELNVDAVRIGVKRTEIKRGVSYVVQSTAGTLADDGKTWICPSCHITITKGTAHTVAWDEVRGIDTRRHFHNHCWKVFQGPLL
jgi:hypothetical protein